MSEDKKILVSINYSLAVASAQIAELMVLSLDGNNEDVLEKAEEVRGALEMSIELLNIVFGKGEAKG